jgi:hypothetical protein
VRKTREQIDQRLECGVPAVEHEPIELGRSGLAARAAADRITRLASRLTRRDQNAPELRSPDAIDEAFAGFQGTALRRTRVDRPGDSQTTSTTQSPGEQNPTAGWEPVKREIIADLSAQLELLDDQRERLARLLRSIDAAQSMSDA